MLLLKLVLSLGVFGHGEDKPGPNGGFIKMPGAFHTEVVLDQKNSLKVYLLDMDWKNPSVNESNVQVVLLGNKSTPSKCEKKADHYYCVFPDSVDLSKKGKLALVSQREKAKGNKVIYDLPLKLAALPKAKPSPAPENGGHESHH